MAWISEAIVEWLRGPMYVHPLMGFIDEHCLIFTPEDENKFEYTTIHGQFQELVDTLLSGFLAELGVTPEEFFKIAGESKDQLTSFVVQTILTVDDFLMFKAMMVKRNMDLTNQVLNAVDEMRVAVEAYPQEDNPSPVYPNMGSPAGAKRLPGGEVDPADLDKAVQMSKTDYEAEARLTALQKLMRTLQLQDEDIALAIAIANSLKDGAKSQSDLAELEQAIALSLALEAEQRRLAAAGGASGGIASIGTSKTGNTSEASMQNQQDFLSRSFPEPKPLPMAPLPKMENFSKGSLPALQHTPLDALNIGPNTAADQMTQIAAAAARAASILSAAGANATPLPVQGGQGSRSVQQDDVVAQGKFTPAPLNVADKLPAMPTASGGSGKFVPQPLNLPDKAAKVVAEVPGVDEFMAGERSSAGAMGKQVSMRNRAAGFKGGVVAGTGKGGGAVDMASVREAASAAAATQKNMIAAHKASGKDGDDAAHAWLQDAKKQLVAKKNAEREAEMAEYQEAHKGSKNKAPKAGGAAAADGEDLEAKRADLRDKLAQKFKQDLMSKGA